MSIVQSVRWGDEGVIIIDQRLLPERRVERELKTLDEVCDAIRTLAVRGAPAIGIAGAMRDVEEAGAVLGPYQDMATVITHVTDHYSERMNIASLGA